LNSYSQESLRVNVEHAPFKDPLWQVYTDNHLGCEIQPFIMIRVPMRETAYAHTVGIEGCPIAIANMGWHFKSTPFEQQIIFSQH